MLGVAGGLPATMRLVGLAPRAPVALRVHLTPLVALTVRPDRVSAIGFVSTHGRLYCI
jgi:hypothetical protein